MKICSKCNQSKSLDEFYKGSSTKDGLKSHCKTCINQHMLDYSRTKYANPLGRAKQMFANAKCRSKRDGLTFTVMLEQIYFAVLLGVCPKTGFRFDLTPTKKGYINPLSPSIDRIDPTKGYEFDNVQIVCTMFNMGKSDQNEVDFIATCIAVAQMNTNNQKAFERLYELRNARL